MFIFITFIKTKSTYFFLNLLITEFKERDDDDSGRASVKKGMPAVMVHISFSLSLLLLMINRGLDKEISK